MIFTNSIIPTVMTDHHELMFNYAHCYDMSLFTKNHQSFCHQNRHYTLTLTYNNVIFSFKLTTLTIIDHDFFNEPRGIIIISGWHALAMFRPSVLMALTCSGVWTCRVKDWLIMEVHDRYAVALVNMLETVALKHAPFVGDFFNWVGMATTSWLEQLDLTWLARVWSCQTKSRRYRRRVFKNRPRSKCSTFLWLAFPYEALQQLCLRCLTRT